MSFAPTFPFAGRLIRTLAICLTVLTACSNAWSLEASTVRIGVLAYLGDEAAEMEWGPMAAHLRATLPDHTIEILTLDHAGMRELARRGEIDFLITNPGHYVELEAELGASRILTLESGIGPSPAASVGSAVVVRAGRDELRTLADLRGQRVAVVSPEAFGGFQLIWRELHALGLDPRRDFRELRSVGFPMDRVLEAVATGSVDAGFVRACLLESRPEYADRLQVLAPRPDPDLGCAVSSQLYPDWPIATLRHTPPALARAVAIALLSTPETSAAPHWAVPADYQSVHEMFRELQIGPYAYLRAPTLMNLAERYWPALAVLVTMLLAWVLYTVRVEHLVHVRTSELREALAARDAIETRMRANQEQAEHMGRLSVLGELSGTLAHELNQPLAAIGNYAQSLVRRADADRLTEAATREAATEIVQQAERAAGILAGIRTFARKRVGERTPRRPGEVVAETVALFRGMLAQAPEVEVHDRLPPSLAIELDALQIQQVILNLLKNGYDASQDLPPERRRLDVTLHTDDDGVGISVRDHGPGLDPAVGARLFEPFLTTKPDGLGLGLSICKRIAEAHGGRLRAAPAADGPGMIFTLILPHHE
ncbi:MAG TPA: PhnD/SsuA/transferrin family substrate-binding protein [Azoarcus taiwanensis]|nr:PhnD/SsuA/transferrin family substrate-binding protein [Azoarcus taiwanensis]